VLWRVFQANEWTFSFISLHFRRFYFCDFIGIRRRRLLRKEKGHASRQTCQVELVARSRKSLTNGLDVVGRLLLSHGARSSVISFKKATKHRFGYFFFSFFFMHSISVKHVFFTICKAERQPLAISRDGDLSNGIRPSFGKQHFQGLL
jgi:hypothetical protein